jgi:hypothetical protein
LQLTLSALVRTIRVGGGLARGCAWPLIRPVCGGRGIIGWLFLHSSREDRDVTMLCHTQILEH